MGGKRIRGRQRDNTHFSFHCAASHSMAFLRPAPFSLPSVFLAPSCEGVPLVAPASLPLAFQGTATAPTATGKRPFEGVEAPDAAVASKKRTDGGHIFPTQFVGDVAAAWGAAFGGPPSCPPAAPPISAPAPSPPVGAARETARGAAVPFRSSPAFDRPLVSGRGGSPCPVCGEGYCVRSPCIAVGRAAALGGAVDDCSMMQTDLTVDGAAACGSGSSAISDDRAPRVQLFGPAAGILESFPWRTVLPAVPLTHPAAASLAAARQSYAIIPYQPPAVPLLPASGSDAVQARSAPRGSGDPRTTGDTGSGNTMMDDDL